MAGLISYVGALADDLSAAATKAAASSIDDVVTQAKQAVSKTAGILVDDTAAIPQYVSDTPAKRELPVIWSITKKSLRNKALMIPVAIAISYYALWLMAPILILGGLYLAFEGVESGAEKLGFIKEHQSSEGDGDKSEGAVVAAAVRTDTILSIEIIALTLSTVVSEPIDTQLWVLAIVGLFATVAVYGIVGLIIKMDDIGFHLRDRHQKNKLLQFIARMLIQGMPKVMKIIGVVGVVAMLMVGGGILIHNMESLHGLTHLGQGLPSILPKMIEVFIIPIAVALIAGSAILILLRSFSKKSKPF